MLIQKTTADKNQQAALVMWYRYFYDCFMDKEVEYVNGEMSSTSCQIVSEDIDMQLSLPFNFDLLFSVKAELKKIVDQASFYLRNAIKLLLLLQQNRTQIIFFEKYDYYCWKIFSTIVFSIDKLFAVFCSMLRLYWDNECCTKLVS